MGKSWQEEMAEKFGWPPRDFVADHIKVCRRKKGITTALRCARSLWWKCKEAGIEPVMSHNDLPEELRNHDKG